jgi:outer membrane biosynthesis protein TonB
MPMRTKRDAWLAAFATVLGVSPLACKQKVEAHPDGPAASHEVSVIAPSVSVSASASPPPVASADDVDAAPVASASAPVASKRDAAPPGEVLSLGQIGQIGHGNGSCGASATCGPTMSVRAPTATISTTVAGAVGDDERVIATMRARFRSCANKGLANDPTEQGKVTLSVTVDEKGDVTDSHVASNNGLGAGTAQCMAAGMRNPQFTAGTKRTLTIAVTSVVQK